MLLSLFRLFQEFAAEKEKTMLTEKRKSIPS
jgi:hypothetical protein